MPMTSPGICLAAIILIVASIAICTSTGHPFGDDHVDNQEKSEELNEDNYDYDTNHSSYYQDDENSHSQLTENSGNGHQKATLQQLPAKSGNGDAEQLKFYEVDAYGDDFTDFGAQTGPHGAFSWRANYPLYVNKNKKE